MLLPQYPFPILDVTPDGWDAGWQLFYNDPTLDGVQFNVNIGGDAASWTPGSGGIYMQPDYHIGLIDPLDPPNYYLEVDGALKFNDPGVSPLSGWTIDNWRYGGSFEITHPDVVARYTAADQIAGAPVTIGERAYHGVASRSAWGSGAYAYIQARDVGKPILVEEWFSDNENKNNQDVSFHGYTHFGDANGNSFYVYWLGNSGEYIRKYVTGVLKRTADSTNPSVSDIVFGVMYTGTLSGGVAVLVVNGVVERVINFTYGAAHKISVDMEFAVDRDAARWNGYAQVFDFLGILVENGPGTSGWPYAAGSSEYVYVDAFRDVGHEAYIETKTIDTYDVKFVNYVDRVSGLGDGVYTGEVLYFNPIMMYTHPGWIGETPIEVFWTNFLGQREEE